MAEQRDLRRAVERHEAGPGRRYAPELRARLEVYARRRRDEGASWYRISEELGVPWESLRRWCVGAPPKRTTSTSSSLVPVVEVAAPVVSSASVSVVSPTGWRLEGLDVRDAVALVRALS